MDLHAQHGCVFDDLRVSLFLSLRNPKGMSTHTYKRHADAAAGGSLDKMAVYQDCLAAFNASPVLAKKCRSLLSQVLRLIYTGETFASKEATDLFFSISKMFHCEDPALRQLCYLAIKELTPMAEDTLMITASIMKDIQGSPSVYKPNAVRTLSRVLDSGTIQAAERLFKNSIVDSNQNVACAALISSYHLLPQAKDVVKRWLNECQESLAVEKSIVPSEYTQHGSQGFSNRVPHTTYAHQYLALGLVYQFRKGDKMSMIKLVQQLTERRNFYSSMAQMELVKFVGKLIEDDSSLLTQFWPLFQSWFNHKSDMVILETCKVVLSGRFNGDQQLQAIGSLQTLLSVPRTVTRFAAVRLLNKVAAKDPSMVRVCNGELEGLISDEAKSISTYAITTLLKTGTDENVDKLVDKLTGSMSDMSPEFKIIVIDAIRTLSLKFPEKNKKMLKFLHGIFLGEGNLEYKSAIMECMFDTIKFIPNNRAYAMDILCDYIEDCEYSEILIRVLHLLGQEGPKTDHPSMYVRTIYNRLVLENSLIRSSAVMALSKFALIGDKSLAKSVRVLLERCLQDSDDEVRDRAALCLRLIDSPQGAKLVKGPTLKYSLTVLESELVSYVHSEDKASFGEAFDIKSVPAMTEEEYLAQQYHKVTSKESVEAENIEEDNSQDENNNENNGSDLTKYTMRMQEYSTQLASLPEIGQYGDLLHSGNAFMLTEPETEFVVKAIKHIFENHLVVQYEIENTLDNIILENVSVGVQSSVYEEEFTLPVEQIQPLSTGSVYVSFKREQGAEIDEFINTLMYQSKEVGDAEDEEGYPDEYQIDDLTINGYDIVKPAFNGNFSAMWDQLSGVEASGVYNLGDITVDEAVAKYVKDMSLLALEGSDYVPTRDTKSHVLKMFGKCVDDASVVAVMGNFVSVSGKGIMMKWVVRGENEEFVNELAESLS